MTFTLAFAEEFWAMVDRRGPDECWEWTGRCAELRGGYGLLGGENLRTHRVAYILTNGAIPPETPFVLHSCDNPPCCNPAHLSAGDDAENVRQMWERGRAVPPPRLRQDGEHNPTAKLTQAQVDEIRSRRDSGEKGVDLAREFGVSQATISEIKNRKHWVSA